MKKLLYIVMIFLLSCTGVGKNKEIDLNHVPVTEINKTDEFALDMVVRPYDMYLIKDYLLLTTRSNHAQYMFHLFDKNNGSLIGSYGAYGKGPSEAYTLNMNYLYIKDSSFFVNQMGSSVKSK